MFVTLNTLKYKEKKVRRYIFLIIRSLIKQLVTAHIYANSVLFHILFSHFHKFKTVKFNEA